MSEEQKLPEPQSPDYLFPDDDLGNKHSNYKPKNRPYSNRVIIYAMIIGVIMLLYVLMNLDNRGNQTAQRMLKLSDIVPPGDRAITDQSWMNETAPTTQPANNQEPIDVAEPLPISEDSPMIVLKDDGTLGVEEKKTETVSNKGPEVISLENTKKDIRVIQRQPTESYKASRNKMLEALYAPPKVPITGEYAGMRVMLENEKQPGEDRTTSDAMGNDTVGEQQEWESIYQNSPLFTQNRGNSGNSDTNATAMAHQDRNDSFIAGKTGTQTPITDEYVPNTRRGSLSKYELKAGSIISGVMMGGVNSDIPGTVVGQVSEHVYDTATGRYLLIPQGSRMVGTYDSHIVFGQTRILVVWNRIVFPDGTSLNIEGMLGADQSGYAGFKQKIENHYTRLIGAALFASVFVAAGKMATDDDESNDEDGAKTDAAEAIMETMTNLGASIAERHLNVAPTLRILPGYRFSIICTKDIAFAEPYIIH